MIPIFSPDAGCRPVTLIERKLGLADAALVVPFESVSGTREGFCFHNVRDVVGERGGEIVYGWLVWQHRNLFVEAEQHSVWRKPTGQLVCVTPQNPPMNSITFIPDPSVTYDFAAELITDNIRIALVNDVRLQQFFEAAEERIEIMNAARQAFGLGPAVKVSRSDYVKLLDLEEKKSMLLTEVASSHMFKVERNVPCPCGSGKKRTSKPCPQIPWASFGGI